MDRKNLLPTCKCGCSMHLVKKQYGLAYIYTWVCPSWKFWKKHDEFSKARWEGTT